MKQDNNLQTWLETATKGVRFGPDRCEVERELRGHIEDKTADMMRVFHLNEKEAERAALEQMGDAEEIGREMARLYKPWLGYLWRMSQVLAAAALALFTLALLYSNFDPGGRAPVSNWRELRESYNQRFVLGEYGGQIVAVGAGTQKVEAGEYTFEVRRASFIEGEDGSRFLWFTVRAHGRFPWELPYKYLGWFQMTDSQGRLYRGRRNEDELGRAQTDCGWTERGSFWIEYEGRTFLWLPGEGATVTGPEEVDFQLEFDNGETRFVIPIRWTEVLE